MFSSFDTELVEECLLNDFLLYVTNHENVLLYKAMGLFPDLTENEWYCLQHFPSECNLFDLHQCEEIKE